MQHIRKLCKLRIITIDCKKILVQIIRTQAEKVDFSAELVEDEPGGGDLNHHTDSDVLLKGDSCACKVLLRLGDFLFESQHLVQRGNHGHHDRNIAKCRGAQDGTQLSLQQLAVFG